MVQLLNSKRKKNQSKSTGRFLISAANTLRSLAGSVFALIINYVLLHYKSPALLNTYIYCITAVALLLVICNWGGREFATRELSRNATQQPQVMGNILLGRLALAVMLSPVVLLLPDIQYAATILVLLLVRSLGSAFEALLIVQKKFRFSLAIELALNSVFVFILFTDNNTGNVAFFLQEWLLFELLRLAAYAWFFRKTVSFGVEFKHVIAVLKSSASFFAVALAGFCCSRADLYVLGLSMEAGDLSRYTILLNFIILCQVLFGAFFGAFASNIFRLTEQAFHNFRQYMLWAGMAFAAAGTLAVYLLSCLFFDSAAGGAFLIMAFINLFAFTSTYTSVYYFMRLDRQLTILKIIVTAGLFNITASTIIVPLYGINGAFACNTGCALLTALLFLLSKGVKTKA